MTIQEALKNTQRIWFHISAPLVVGTAAREFVERFRWIELRPTDKVTQACGKGTFCIAVAKPDQLRTFEIEDDLSQQDNYICFKIGEDGSGWLIASHAHFLYSFVHHLLDDLLDRDTENFAKGVVVVPSFKWQRVSFDYFLTQEGRIQKGLNRETYVRELARLGFTHIEVNGLAYPMSLETGPKGEIYPMFYTYCPALDQFVYSELNKGLYPYYYLSANLNRLKENAALARKYGLEPGMLCFEPRSVPERFFERYPMLRGARVDHPFRSFKPRYNMTVTHPKVREHYTEMLQKIMHEVPELGFLTIWTNDSGSGFEHTKSLYVGRNGGAYLIREWKDDAEIARLAGENALRFFRTLRDAGREINPKFRVLTRLESFYGEHETVWRGLGDGVDAETASLVARGWDMPYTHPKYPDNQAINAGSVYQQAFDKREKPLMNELEARNSRAHFYFAAGPHTMFQPLLGVPYPFLTWQRLKTLRDNGVQYLACSGGAFPPELVPYNVNQEVCRRFMFEPAADVEKVVGELARHWVGADHAATLVEAWKLTEDAILAFPNISPLYSTFGFTWYRLWVRPLVPNIEAIPQEQRNYYEQFMCTTPQNPNNVDLSRDVLFRIVTPEKSQLNVQRIDDNLWKPLDQAISILSDKLSAVSSQLSAISTNAIFDQLIRLRALRCWFMTQRNVAAWIAGVYGYMDDTGEDAKKRWHKYLKDAIQKEIANSHEVLELLDAGIEFMTLTDQGESPLVYGTNLRELIPKRIQLMEEHIDDEPYIDHNYIERRAADASV